MRPAPTDFASLLDSAGISWSPNTFEGAAPAEELLRLIFRSQQRSEQLLASLLDRLDAGAAAPDAGRGEGRCMSEADWADAKAAAHHAEVSGPCGVGDTHAVGMEGCHNVGHDCCGGDQVIASTCSLSDADSHGHERAPVASQLRDIKRRFPEGHDGGCDCHMCLRPSLSSLELEHAGFLAQKSGPLYRSARASPAFHWVQDPNSIFHVPWSLLGLVILAVDLTLAPFVLAFDVSFSDFTTAFSCTSVSYWTLDVVINFVVGFYMDGLLITDMRSIGMNYAKSTLALDLVLVAADWVSVILLFASGEVSSNGGSLRLLRFAKLGKMFRVFSLLRVMSFVRLISRLVERMLSERVRMMVHATAMAALTLWFTHVLACVWVVIGFRGIVAGSLHWGDEFQGSHLEVYIAAVHWALAQITLGSSDIVCNNWAERLFNILCLIIGLIIGTTLISTLSAAMVELQMAQKDRTMRLRTLRQYLQENMIKGSMSLLVQQQVIERMDERRRLVDAQVPALEMLSVSLRAELRFEIVKPYLFKHQLFSFISAKDFQWCICFCQTAVGVVVLSVKDDLFLVDDFAKATYILMRGNMCYSVDCSSLRTSASTWHHHKGMFLHSCMGDEYTLVKPHEWLAEAALWTEWVHVGRAMAREICQVMTIEPDEFQQSFQRFPLSLSIAREYGKQFHQRILDAASLNDGAQPTDLMVPDTEWDDLVFSMCASVQKAVSCAAMDVLESHLKRSALRRSLKHENDCGLRQEIKDGKCIVVLDKLGIPERIVSIAALQLSHEDGCILTQIGKWDPSAGGLVPICALPGMKRKPHKANADALRQLLTTKFHPLAGSVQLRHIEKSVIRRHSHRFQVKTKYLRDVFVGDLCAAFDAPSCTAKDPHWRWGNGSANGSDDACMGGLADDSAVTSTRSEQSIGVGRVGPTMSREAEQTESMGSFVSFFGGAGRYATRGTIKQELLDKEVFFFRYNGGGAFCAWLTQQEIAQLSEPSAETILLNWLRALGTPPLAPQANRLSCI